jgi:tripartite-type tricarboxylate transporter receptor subunit TctC
VDVVARLLQPHLTKTLGKTVVVENKPGASGTIAIRQLENTAPDAQVYGFYPTTTMMGFVLQGHEPALDRVTTITEMYDQFTVYAINPTVAGLADVHTLKDLVEAARKNPGGINYSTAGVGSISHLTTEKLCNLAGVKMQHVSYKGSQLGLQDMLAGQIGMVAMDPTNLSAHLGSPKVRAIAINYPERVPYLPNVPTTAEAGYKELASVFAWVTFVGPAKMPAEQVKKMQDAVHQAVNDPAINKRMRELYAIPKTGTPEQARARMQSDLKFWKKVIADNNIKV